MAAPQIRILVVEDDTVDRMACLRALSQAPDRFVFLQAETGREGLQLAATQQPDCILLDYHLPDMDGLEFLRKLSEEGEEIAIPVLMLTGADNAAVAVEAMRRGARDYLVKDMDRRYLELLLTVLQRVLREQRALTEKKRAVEQLRQAEAKFRTLVEQIPAITYIVALDPPGSLLYVSPQIGELGFSPQEWMADPKVWVGQIHPDDRMRVTEVLAQRRLQGDPLCCEYRVLARDGRVLWFRDQASVVRDEEGVPLFLQGILVDMSDSKRVEEELREHRYRLEELVARRTAALTRANGQLRQDIIERQRMEQILFQEKERAQVTLEAIGDAVITTDAQGRVEYLNPVAEQLTGWDNIQAQGRPLEQVFHIVHEETRKAAENPVTLCLREGQSERAPRNNILLRRDGTEFVVTNCASPIHERDATVVGAVVVFHDVTREHRLTQKLSYQATHDALTGLVNRHEFERRLGRVLKSASAGDAEHALCFLDLDRFKAVNDTGGHAAGDELLRQISALLQEKVRQRDTLARLGGDEFGVLLERCPADQAWHIAEELLQAIQDFRFSWDGQTFSVGASIGIVAVDTTAEGLSDILSAADAACYTAKKCGRNRIHMYREDDGELTRRRSESYWVSRLTRALQDDTLQLYCQPITALAAGGKRHSHHEILLRLIGQDGETVAPAVFLPAAERYNLAPAIDRWVIRRTIAWLGKRHSKGTRDDGVYFINLSAASLADKTLPDYIRDLLREHRVAAATLGFEISENAVMTNLSQAEHFIRALKQPGCRTTLDNFGGTFFAIPNLKSLPVDFIKISGAFVRDMLADPVAHALVEAINQVAHVMVIQTVAGCVESTAVMERLRELGVDHVQGYALSSPRPLEEEPGHGERPSKKGQARKVAPAQDSGAKE